MALKQIMAALQVSKILTFNKLEALISLQLHLSKWLQPSPSLIFMKSTEVIVYMAMAWWVIQEAEHY